MERYSLSVHTLITWQISLRVVNICGGAGHDNPVGKAEMASRSALVYGESYHHGFSLLAETFGDLSCHIHH
jgi:hypothetical protein